jgi:arylsulfotransferase ASST/IPT/TIG domain-containing protein
VRVKLATLVLVPAVVSLGGTGSPALARSAAPVTLQVRGSLSSITTSELTLSPAFTRSTTDYVLRCRPGNNPVAVTFTASPGGTIQIGSESGPRVTVQVVLAENQPIVVDAVDATGSYWIRCLPSDFPPLTVTRPGNPPPGWYLTGNIAAARGSSTYVMILNSHGTPVWYQKTAGPGAINVTPVAHNIITWASDAGPGFGTDPTDAFNLYDLATQATHRLTAPTPPLDFHELLPLEDGGRLMLASPLRAGVDLRPLGLARDQTIVDCVVEEITGAGQLGWSWRASDHIIPRESVHPFPVTVERQKAYDLYHCNSVDRDPATGDLLLSLRHADAVYRIDRRGGSIRWKLGGNSIVGDHEQRLAISGGPSAVFHGQHDARFQPNGDISLYDNHTWYVGAARGVEYHIDTRLGTANIVWEYRSADSGHSNATGSFRRYEQGSDNLVTWGFKPNSLFTEVDAAGRLLMDVGFPNGDTAYRTIKTPPGELDIGLLRDTAGLPAASFPPVPRIFSLGVDSSGASKRSSVTITGSGFSGATAVTFGRQAASSYSVVSDGVITAVAPPGTGIVTVAVTTPGGTSQRLPVSMLAPSDGAFTAGTGSWKQRVNTSVDLSRKAFRSRPFALGLNPTRNGPCSTLTDGYQVAGNADLTGSAWVKAASGHMKMRSALVFYDALGSVLWINQGRWTRVTGRWARVAVTGVSPAGTASAALAVEGLDCRTPLYLDDASLTGEARFAYEGSVLKVTSVAPSRGSGDGGTIVTVTGEGFSGATSVRFGASEARSFTVTSDSSITAVAPPGTGAVDITVTTRAGVSPKGPQNVLTAGDSSFEQGPGSWVGNVNASAVSSKRARGGEHSLDSRPAQRGFQSVISGAYPASAGALFNLGLWVHAPRLSQQVVPFMIFYGPGGEVLSIEQAGAFVKTSPTAWTRLTLSARSPEGTASVAVGVDDVDGESDLYLDDVVLTGSTRFAYR